MTDQWQPFRNGDDLAERLRSRQKGQIIVTDGVNCMTLDDPKKRKTMDPSKNKPLYGGAEVIDRHGVSAGAPVPKPPPVDIRAMLQNMGYGARMAWWRRNRPSLDQVAKNPAGLSTSQQKAHDKKMRKRAANLARLGKFS